MKTIVLVVLVVVQLVFSAPDTPYRQISGYFETSETTKTGEVRLDTQGETIKNITTEFDSTAKNITIKVLEGGVGYSYVTLSYEVPPEGEGTSDTYVLTSESDVFVKRPVTSKAPRESPPDVAFAYLANYDRSETPRTDNFSAVFDEKALTCSGSSEWWYGNGSREIKGGYPNNYFNVVLGIPAGVAGMSEYSCDYPNDDASAVSVQPLTRSTEAEQCTALLQLYMTFDYTTTPAQYSGMYRTPEILSYEGGVEWFNGTGTFDIYGGGTGYDYIYYNYTHDAYTYGIFDYNFVIAFGIVC